MLVSFFRKYLQNKESRSSLRGLLSGGSWNNNTNAGRGLSNLNNGPSNRNLNIGLRCGLSLELFYCESW